MGFYKLDAVAASNGGVHTCLQFIFGVADRHDPRLVLEEGQCSVCPMYLQYVFEVADMGEHGTTREHVTIEAVKGDVVRAIKTIVTLVHTLDAAPTESKTPKDASIYCSQIAIFMKIHHGQDSEWEYQPPCFQDAGNLGVGYFSTKPFQINVGSLSTTRHVISIGIRSILDSVDIVPGLGKVYDDISIKESITDTTRETDVGETPEDGPGTIDGGQAMEYLSWVTRRATYARLTCGTIGFLHSAEDLRELFTETDNMQENLLALLQDDDLCRSLSGGNVDDLGSRRNSGLHPRSSHQVGTSDSVSIESNGAGLRSPAPSPVARTHKRVQQGRGNSLSKMKKNGSIHGF
eukprot:jgi/Picsp_1/1984/NSC_05450-R1_horma domain-containing protein